MKKCPFCAEEIQDKAVVCRYCGRELTTKAEQAKEDPSNKSGHNAIVIFIGVLIFTCIIVLVVSNLPDKRSTDTSTTYAAYYACQEFVSRTLIAPKTAEYPLSNEVQISRDGNVYTVCAYVDAENSFGALVRNDFVCIVEQPSEDQWTLQSLDME